MTRRQRSLTPLGRATLALGVLLACAGTAVHAQGEAPPRADDRLSRGISVEVRAADIGEVTSQLSRAVNIGLDAEPDIATQRITIYATNTSVQSLQNGLADLLHTTWRHFGDGPQSRYRLVDNSQLQAEADRLRLQRRATFLTRLLQTEQAMRSGDPDALARDARASILARFPSYPPDILADITPDMLRQSLLLAPMRLGVTRVVQQSGSAWVPLNRLPAPYQELLGEYAIRQLQGPSAPAPPDGGVAAAPPAQPVVVAEQVLADPQARAEYRLLFGDRWTDTLMLVRIGESDHWATAMLPSVIFDIPDYGSLYPETRKRPDDPEFRRRLGLKLDTDVLNWDQALSLICKSAKIDALSDSYPRPDIFRPEGPGPVLANGSLEETLDQVAAYYGYVWWKQDGWYLFRNRLWAEQNRVSVPQRLLQSIGTSLAGNEHLSPSALASLAALTDEQLLTLHLSGSAAGRTYAPEDAFDYNEMQLAHAGLTLFGQMSDEQRSMARQIGVPYTLMSPVQQYLFASTARDRGILLENDDPQRLRFRLSDVFHREKLPAGWAELGTIQFQFDYGAGGRRTAELAVRAPAVGQPANSDKGEVDQ